MSIKKQYLKSRPTCKVTFRISKDAAKEAKNISLVGEFNEWDSSVSPMKALKNGDFTAMVELSTDKPEYQFRYLCDDSLWVNDGEADAYIPNGLDGDNSVVRVQA